MQEFTSAGSAVPTPARRDWLLGRLPGLASAGVWLASRGPRIAAAGSLLAAPGLLVAARPAGHGSAAASGPLFTLGVASGFPTDQGMTLWTRLAPHPMAEDGGMPARPVPVRWTIASDAAMRHPVRDGQALAAPGRVHSVHVDVAGLAPDRPYWYRFEALGQQSPIGRTRTLPHPDAVAVTGLDGGGLTIAVASCQNIEHGWYTAHRHIAASRPDLVLHLGDYIYEATWGQQLVRPHGLPTARSLADYRRRYALYRLDPDLQAAHAIAPWFLVQDDHEVANDYAGLSPERLQDAPTFAARRSAAWQAWFEHLPIPARLAPDDGTLPRPDVVRIGRQAALYLLDTRQFRAAQACPPAGRGGGNSVVAAECAALGDPARSLLGRTQEHWLDRAFARADARWNLIGQQTLVSTLRHPGRQPGRETIRTDGWDGYPAARERLLDAMAGHRLANPIVIGGDLHTHYVADLRRGAAGDGAMVATEFVGTSITSQAGSPAHYERLLAANPHLRHADGRYRGYLRLTLAPRQLLAEAFGVENIRLPDSPVAVRARWVVESGRLGAQKA